PCWTCLRRYLDVIDAIELVAHDHGGTNPVRLRRRHLERFAATMDRALIENRSALGLFAPGFCEVASLLTRSVSVAGLQATLYLVQASDLPGSALLSTSAPNVVALAHRAARRSLRHHALADIGNCIRIVDERVLPAARWQVIDARIGGVRHREDFELHGYV